MLANEILLNQLVVVACWLCKLRFLIGMWPIDQNCYLWWTECKAYKVSSFAKSFVFRRENKIKLKIIKLFLRLIFLLLLWHRNWQQLRLPTKRIQNYARYKRIFAFNQQKIPCGILGPEVFSFVLIANLCFEESTQNISLLFPANVFVSVFFSKEEEKMFSATSLTGNWILKSLNIPTGPPSGARKTLTTEIWNVASISSSKWDAMISPFKRS